MPHHNFNACIRSGTEGNRNAILHHQFNIDIIINQLKGCVEYYHSQKAVVESYIRQKSSLGCSFKLDSSGKDFIDQYIKFSNFFFVPRTQLSRNTWIYV